MMIKTGIIIGLFGAVGSYTGTIVASQLPENLLIWVSASLLFLSGFLIWFRTRVSHHVPSKESDKTTSHFWLVAPFIGLSTGFLSGCFGIGSTPLIQLGLLVFLNMTLQQAASTSMLILIPVSFFGAVGFYQAGFIDWLLLFQIVAGTMTGSYIGAKFTSRAPVYILRTVIIALPVFGGVLLLT